MRHLSNMAWLSVAGLVATAAGMLLQIAAGAAGMVVRPRGAIYRVRSFGSARWPGPWAAEAPHPLGSAQ